MERFGNSVFQFCGLKTLAFPARHLVHRPVHRSLGRGGSSATRNEVGSLGGGGSLPCRAGLSRQSGTETEAGRRREPFLSRRSVTKTEAFAVLAFSLQPLALVSVLGKFGGADQLRNAVPKLQEPKCHFSRTDPFTDPFMRRSSRLSIWH
jgi:nitrate reductase NapE component